MNGSQALMNSKIKNKAGLTNEAIVLLIKDFTCLTAIDSSLEGRTLHYLLDGDDQEILAELEIVDIFFKAPNFAPKLKTTETRNALFKEESEQSEEFLHRLGNVYHALMNPLNPNHLMPQRLKSPSWLEALLLFSSSSYSGELKTYIQLKIVEKILLAAEEGLDKMVEFIFLIDPTDFNNCKIIQSFFSLTGFTSSVIDHIQIIKKALTNIDNNTKFRALRNISALSIPTEPLLPEIAQCCVASQKKIRSAALSILENYPDQAGSLLKELIKNKDITQKNYAIQAIHTLSPKKSKKYLTGILKKEKDKKVIKVISDIL